MKSTTIVYEHQFDEELLEQLENLRTVRLNLAEKMLSELPKTMTNLKAQGLPGGHHLVVDEKELRKELEDKVSLFRSRIKHPDIVYADEISFYVDLIDNDVNLQNVEIF